MGNIGQHYYKWRYCEPGGQIDSFWDTVNQQDFSWAPDWTAVGYYDPDTASYILESTGADFEAPIVYIPSDVTLPRDFTVTAEAITLTDDTTDGSWADVYYRFKSNEEFVATSLGMDGTLVSWFATPTGVDVLAETSAPSFRAGYGAINRIRVIIQGSMARVFLNDTFVHSFQFDAQTDLTVNGFGVGIERYEWSEASVTRFGFRMLVAQQWKATSCT
jgi:hypothetical protein